MVQCLQLEGALLGMLVKLPNYLLCVLCFLAALCEFAPPSSFHKVHQHIGYHFHLDDINSIHVLQDIYPYIAKFTEKNEELQATSSQYWCERRYREAYWNDAIEAPQVSCRSPRMYALGRASDNSYSWSSLCAGTSSSAVHCQGDFPLDTSVPESSGSYATRESPACVDNDALLQEEEGDAGMSCSTSAARVCDMDIGIMACPYTCGYCAPFRYEPIKMFEKPQVTMLPVIVYQTRFPPAACHGFAAIYAKQPYNPQQVLLPPMDGYRQGQVLACVDRAQDFEEPFRAEHVCPKDAPASRCGLDGLLRDTPRHYFQDRPVYPKVMIEPTLDIEQMRALNWIDLYTRELTLSTMVYTEGAEIFTSVSVVFTMDEAGTVMARRKLVSYRDLSGGSRTTFIACLVVCCLGAFVGMLLTASQMWYVPDTCRKGDTLFELMSRTVLCTYSLALLVSWSLQTPMADEYNRLLHSFIDSPASSSQSLQNMIASFLEAKGYMLDETDWHANHRCAAYVVIYMQFLQLIFYFSAHPKMGVLTATVSRAMTNIIHFLLLFGLLFLMLAFMAHWMLADHIPEFATFGDTVAAQSRMIYGEFIYASGADDLHGLYVVMYWLYASTFMLVIFFTLLNFFLAILVDAFGDVKASEDVLTAARGFLTDILSLVWTCAVASKHKWPKRRVLLGFFTTHGAKEAVRKLEAIVRGVEEEAPRPLCSPADLQQAFPDAFGTRKQVALFLAHYCNKCEDILCSRESFLLAPPTGVKRDASAPDILKGAQGQREELWAQAPAGEPEVLPPGSVDQ
mmetsp:Transcript_17844/g.32328  ORF Transcript_17844/g.32328 Transcript_17844/m.32328 type:complete len:794 (-) Transcript_17844:100-2481(-)